MKLLYVLALMTATALAAPTEVESSQILGKRGCPAPPTALVVAPSLTATNQSASATQTTTVTATATATTVNSASLLWVASRCQIGRRELCASGEERAGSERRVWL
ncbi:hypothetical protein V498_00346 [Pseudogymnoascus sp. VKM F-4517 (FW-2822)]|nr:hypothetical protein V498_00346 [Pseudogymnoascus sp. VKM F-4517 (FW-2822)]